MAIRDWAKDALRVTNPGAWENDTASALNTEVTLVNWMDEKEVIVWH